MTSVVGGQMVFPSGGQQVHNKRQSHSQVNMNLNNTQALRASVTDQFGLGQVRAGAIPYETQYNKFTQPW